MLPGLDPDQQPICRRCAAIPTDLDCHRCGAEAEHYRRGGLCARCALRDDLTALLAPTAPPPPKIAKLIGVFCSVERPESIHTWKRRPAVHALLTGLGDGTVELTHHAFDAADGGRAVEHLRDLLVHHELLPHRDRDLARFQRWLDTRLAETEPDWIRRTLERYARWHHIRAIRGHLADGRSAQARVHHAKQDITEVGRLLDWLHQQNTTLAGISQAQLDRWIGDGPSTRHDIRGFLGWAQHHRLTGRGLELARREVRSFPITTHEERLEGLRRCLTGEPDTLAYRVAAVIVLLYAQPLVRIVRLRREQVALTPTGVALELGDEAADVPKPLVELLRQHLAQLPHARTTNATNPWLFPGVRAGQHLHPDTLAGRLRNIGIDIGTRNAVLRELVERVPPPIAASQLGYSNAVMHRHAERAAQPHEHYAALLRAEVAPVAPISTTAPAPSAP